jgi:hypothetical protein
MFPNWLNWLRICRAALGALVLVVGLAGSSLGFVAIEKPRLEPYQELTVGNCDQATRSTPTGRLSRTRVVKSDSLSLTRECGDGSFDWVELKQPGRPNVRAALARHTPATAYLFEDGTTVLEGAPGDRLATSESGAIKLKDKQYLTQKGAPSLLRRVTEWLPAAASLCALLGVALHSRVARRKAATVAAAVEGWIDGERFVPGDKRFEVFIPAQTPTVQGPAIAFGLVPRGGYRDSHDAAVSPGSRTGHLQQLLQAELKCRTAALLLVSAAALLALLVRFGG